MRKTFYKVKKRYDLGWKMAAGLKLGMHNMHVATAITIIEVFHHKEVKVGNIFITSCSIDLV